MTVTTYLLIAIIAILVLFFLFQNKNKSYQDISSDELKELMKNKDVDLIDVRTSREVQAGVIGTPHRIELSSSFGKDVQKLNKDKKYVVYCRSGRRSAMASNMMSKLGFKEVYNLKGGYNSWNG